MVQNNWTQNNKTKANKKTNDKLEEMTSLKKPNLVIDKLMIMLRSSIKAQMMWRT